MTVNREHYLRDDITCGWAACAVCKQANKPPLISGTALLPDTNVVLHQLDLLEHHAISNVILTSTVLQEVKHRSTAAYNRLRALIRDDARRYFVFSNEHCRATYVEAVRGESPNDRNDRAIRVATAWYKTHVDSQAHATAQAMAEAGADVGGGGVGGPSNAETSADDAMMVEDALLHVILLTNDEDNLRKARGDGLKAYKVKDYVERFSGVPELVDIVAGGSGGGGGGGESDFVPDRAGPADFEKHLTLKEIQVGLKTGTLYQGTFHTSRDTRREGYVNVRGLDHPVLLRGKHMNRAIEGDIVALRLLPQAEWKASSDAFDEVGGETEEVEGASVSANAPAEDAAAAAAAAAAVTDHSASCDALTTTPIRPNGRIVGIVKRNWRPYCGVIQDKSQRGSGTGVFFVPQDRRVPRIRIQTRQADALDAMRIVVCIDSWPAESRSPMGHYVRTLGPAGDVDTETEVVLIEHDVPYDPFSQAVMSCLPGADWSVVSAIARDGGLGGRRDLRHLVVCSIDPPGCTDIDDALHVRVLENGNFEVGVHIADVTHFVRPGSALDLEAARRGTTVYLSNRRIDMVPALLSSNLCSLRGGEERFAFSCLWELTPDAEVVRTEFFKSVIRSRRAFMYSEAQMVIDDASDGSEMAVGLRALNSLSKKLRAARIRKGALMLASPEVRFSLDSETHDPVELQAKELHETNSLVEEFMLLANVSVAAQIHRHFPACAVLRRHPTPPPGNFEPLLTAARSAGIELSTATSLELARSLEAIAEKGQPQLSTLLRIQATRCMLQAVYFSSGTVTEAEYAHYGLASPIYTHFTSPIRRYADVLVHRLLAASVLADQTYAELLDKDVAAATCDTLNHRHRMAQHASRASVDLHSILFFRGRASYHEGYVMRVRNNALAVLIPQFGLEGPVYLAPPSRKDGGSDGAGGATAAAATAAAAAGRESKPVLIYNPELPSLTVKAGSLCATFKTFDRVTVRVTVDETHIQHRKIVMELAKPCLPGISPPPDVIRSEWQEPLLQPPESKRAKSVETL